MGTESNSTTLASSRNTFWLSRSTLEKRLSFSLPVYQADDFSIVTTDLASNASFVNYVRHHRLTHLATGATVDVIEKSIRKILFITSLESRFYRERYVLSESVHFKHPTCLGVIETPWESLIFTSYIQGRPPRMSSIAKTVAPGIAEIEALSSLHLNLASSWQAPKFWTMDFFRPWYMLRSRFNYERYLHSLEELARDDDRFADLPRRLRALRPILRREANGAKRGQRCFCHMDYLRKNFFLSPQGLQMIDWSEFKVGRVGFDGGSYLSAVFRRSDMERFMTVREEFLATYLEVLDTRFDQQQALRNLNYFFLQNSLWHFLRPKTIADYQRRGKLDLLHEKYEYLLAMPVTSGR
ncbi:phosphotransferase family protein [Pseudomonas putida]|uniref:phosphotransferase family protein n=1 Tax=Pseudomonas putida TaxID=303 RepID=UPI0023641F76|nr:phosphotransferase [Pseudomonas putida]MDD2104022.1 aminoglycoside phosphotransferase family protein [Pseudomonas putida]